MAKTVRKAFHSFRFWVLTVVTACLVWFRMQLKPTSTVFKAVDELAKYMGILLVPVANARLATATVIGRHPKPSERNGSRRISLVQKPKKRR